MLPAITDKWLSVSATSLLSIVIVLVEYKLPVPPAVRVRAVLASSFAVVVVATSVKAEAVTPGDETIWGDVIPSGKDTLLAGVVFLDMVLAFIVGASKLPPDVTAAVPVLFVNAVFP